MDTTQILKAIEELKAQPKRKFAQSYDLIINLRDFSPKQQAVDFAVTMPHPKGRDIKVACFAGQELDAEAREHCDLVIKQEDLAKYKADPKSAKKLADSYDYFVAQATLMPKIAAAMGKTLGTKGKMPNPKMGCVVPPNASLGPLVKRLQNSVRLASKKATNLQCIVGKESMPDQEVAENILAVYKAAVHNLPNEANNVKKVLLKLTMGKPVQIQ